MIEKRKTQHKFSFSLSPSPAPPAALPAAQAAAQAADAAHPTPSFLAYTFIIDDLVLPDGRTEMGAVGGSGPQAAWGWAVGCRLVGMAGDAAAAAVVAGIGPDLPGPARAWLTTALGPAGDACLMPWPTAGATATSAASPPPPTPRAWQVLEGDDRRTQVWRTPGTRSRAAMLLPGPRSLPPGVLGGARAVHAGVHPGRARDLAWAASTAAAAGPGVWVSLETYQEAEAPPPAACLARLLATATVFSPNEAEQASLVGREGGVVGGARRLLGLAPPGGPMRGVLVRCGGGGAVWVPRAAGAPVLAAPAALGPAAVRDTTGCGNAFLGAWTAAWAAAGGADAAHTALAVGAAAAAATAEVVGPPPAALDGGLLATARERMEAVRARVVVVEG